jgi:hypothetical protein
MTDPSGYAKTLALPAGFDAPRLLRYDDVTAHAMTREDLGEAAAIALAVHDPSWPWSSLGGISTRGSTSLRMRIPNGSAKART